MEGCRDTLVLLTIYNIFYRFRMGGGGGGGEHKRRDRSVHTPDIAAPSKKDVVNQCLEFEVSVVNSYKTGSLSL